MDPFGPIPVSTATKLKIELDILPKLHYIGSKPTDGKVFAKIEFSK